MTLQHPLDRANLALALLATLLGGALLLAGAGDRPWPPLTALDPASARELRLLKGDDLQWALLAGPEGWTLTHPAARGADAGRVRELLGLVATPSFEHFPAPADLRPYGLDTPAYRLVVDGLEIAFGSLEPTTAHRYVLVDGQVHLIGDGFHHHVVGGPHRFAVERD